MDLVDANIVLRYILWDNDELAEKAEAIIEHRDIEIPFEVIAEIVYVLEGVYSVNRSEIFDGIINLIDYPNISTKDPDVLNEAFRIFSSSNLDFVDSILIGYNKVRGISVHSFDKKLNKLINNV